MLFTIVEGISLGFIYALVAMGYSLIYRTTGVVNFAQGAFVMVGGMATYWAFGVLHMPFLAAVFVGLLITALVGLILWMALVLPLWKRGSAGFVVILATLVFADLADNVFEKWLGTNPESLPAWVNGRLVIGSFGISFEYLVIIVVSVIIMIGVGLFLAKTSTGIAMRACAADRVTSQLLGISPQAVGGIAMVSTAIFGGLAGIMLAPVQYASYSIGLTYGVFGFVAAIIGGFGSLPGAVVGGIAVGLIESIAGRYVSSTYEVVIALVLLLVLLVIRPAGLLGKASDI
jgi:branched-chain amino acid transport system permease protein